MHLNRIRSADSRKIKRVASDTRQVCIRTQFSRRVKCFNFVDEQSKGVTEPLLTHFDFIG